jgi:hypothetical protein
VTKEGNFIIFAIEQYKKAMKLQGKDVVELFKKHDIFELIRKSYFIYHIEREQNMIDDINAYIFASQRKLAMRNFSILAVLAAALLFLVSCGKHSFEDVFDDIFGNSSSSSGNGTVPGVVGPLIQTQWAQRSPFNDLFPMVDASQGFSVDNTGRAITNCSNTAMAQIMEFHRHPARGSGSSTLITIHPQAVSVPAVNLDVTFDWDNMLRTYPNANSGTERERNAVATLLYHLAAASGANNRSNIQALINNFGYDRSIQRLERKFYTDAQWEAIIRQQLDLGLPVYYWGCAADGNASRAHAFIVDGYDDSGRFHINMGWSGRDDGWYFLNNINPRDYDFNHEQIMIINIRPDAGSTGSNDMALISFAVAKTTVTQNEALTISFRPRSSGFFPGGQFGAALVDNNGNIVEVIGVMNRSELRPGTAWTLAYDPLVFNTFVPETVSPGQYRLQIVSRITNGEWKIITASDLTAGVPNAINLTVTAETGARGGGHGISLNSLTVSSTAATRNTPFTVSVRPQNTGSNDFPGGQLGAALVDNNGNIVEVIGTRNLSALTPGRGWFERNDPLVINCSVPNTVPPGQYRLRIVVRPTDGEWRLATLSLPEVPNSIDFTVE